MKRNKAFTLVELLIASGIFLILIIGIYSAFRTGMLGYSNISNTIDITQSARQIFERLNLDLRNCFPYSENSAKLSGTKNSLSFFTLVDSFDQGALTRKYALVLYNLDGNKLTRLIRADKESLNDKSEILPEEMSRDIENISFSYGYFDADTKSLQFQDTWGNKDAKKEQKMLPVAVKVKLSVKIKSQQDFERIIYLPAGIQ
jgi:prepilin-type N-terminal cleavage/methylation domain-containing protein